MSLCVGWNAYPWYVRDEGEWTDAMLDRARAGSLRRAVEGREGNDVVQPWTPLTQ